MEKYYLRVLNNKNEEKYIEIKDFNSDANLYNLNEYLIIDANGVPGVVYELNDNYYDNKNYFFYCVNSNNKVIEIKMTKNLIIYYEILNINFVNNKISIQYKKVDDNNLSRPSSNLSSITEYSIDNHVKNDINVTLEVPTYADKARCNSKDAKQLSGRLTPKSEALKELGIDSEKTKKAIQLVKNLSNRDFKINLIKQFIDEIITKFKEQNISKKIGSNTMNMFKIIQDLLNNKEYRIFFSMSENSISYWKDLNIVHPIEQLKKTILDELGLKSHISSDTIKSNDVKFKFYVNNIKVLLYKDTLDENNIKYFSPYYVIDQ